MDSSLQCIEQLKNANTLIERLVLKFEKKLNGCDILPFINGIKIILLAKFTVIVRRSYLQQIRLCLVGFEY